ncbi:hypothetical protein [Leptolyngbya sp. PCC 6406]|nr:hypothetical protein [Leptolyngbya sp. PCC 6406]
MSLWILDTDPVSLFQRGYAEVVQRVSQSESENLAIAINNSPLIALYG